MDDKPTGPLRGAVLLVRSQPSPPWWKRLPTKVTATVSAIAVTVVGGFLASWFVWFAGPSQSAQELARPISTSRIQPIGHSSGPGLGVETSAFYVADVDTSFVTKDAFPPSSSLNAVLSGQDFYADASALTAAGAIPLGETIFDLIVTGESDQVVRIINITASILKRGKAWHGDEFFNGPQGTPGNIMMELNLNTSLPVLYNGVLDSPWFDRQTITLQPREQEVIVIDSQLLVGYVAYNLKVDYLVGTQPRSLLITNHGKPFQISGYLSNPYKYSHNSLTCSGYEYTFGLLDYIPEPAPSPNSCK